MENIEKSAYSTRILGIVTLYNPNSKEAAENILRYLPDIDKLIVWDNSPLEKNLKEQMHSLLDKEWEKIVWHGTGENLCIAKGINFAWEYAREHSYDSILIMDQDSQWDDFSTFRRKTEEKMMHGKPCVFTPFVKGNDRWVVTDEVQECSLFINSGTLMPLAILDSLNGADETFPLDALDYDLSLRTRKRGYKIFCITKCKLGHTMGQPRRSNFLRLYTPNYSSARKYSIVRSHIISYRKNRHIMTAYECRRVFKEFIYWMFVRIIIAENDKMVKLKMFFKGIKDGITFNLKSTKP